MRNEQGLKARGFKARGFNKLIAWGLAALLALASWPLAADRAGAATLYEAESAALSGGATVATDHAGYSGTGFVGGYTDGNKGNAATAFGVSVTAAGSYTAELRYANGTGSAKTLSLYVDGTKQKSISLSATSSWDSWNTQTETLSLAAGSHTIAYKFDSSDTGNVNLDRLSLDAVGSGGTGTNLALNKTVVSSGTVSGYAASNAVDGNVSTYYEGAAGAYPNTLTVDLGSSYQVSSIAIKLPSSWGTRTQTLSVSGSADNSTYATLASSGTYTFNPAAGNSATVTFTAAAARYVRVSFTANSGATGGQAAELEVYGTGGSTTPTEPTTPSYPASPQSAYEAEAAELTGGATTAADHAGYSGTGFVGGFTDSNKGSAAATFYVNVETAGDYQATLRYANGSGVAQMLSLYANGTKSGQTALAAASNWDTWATKTDTIALSAGHNTIMYKYDTSDSGNVNLDRLDLVKATEPTNPTTPPEGTYGATMPYDSYEAESATYTGTRIGPSTTFGTLASEASGRQAVQLTAAGQYVQITLAKAARGLTIRYSIPDNAAGTGIDSAISLYVGGTYKQDIPLTSKYSWIYGSWGTEGGEKRWSNNPNATPTTPHHFYDEVAVTLDQTYAAGTVIKLQRNSSNLNFSQTANVTIDLLETEEVPTALSKPANYVSVADYGAVANDGADDTTAFNNAINAVKNSAGAYAGVWIPSGTFTLSNGTTGAGYNGTGTRLYLDSGVSMKGAGVWYSKLEGSYAGIYLRGGNVTLSDFKLSPSDTLRDDYNGVSGVEGNGTNSTLTNLWIEHAKVGFWLTNQTNAATISNSRVRSVWADGINLHYGTANTTVTNNSIRGSGDDGLAMWSDTYLDTNNTFSYNTVQVPTLANNIAIYGGQNNSVIGNLVMDTVVNGSGISFGTNFDPPSMTGTLTIQNNVLIRAGSAHKDYGYQIGAIWAYWLNNNGRAQNLTVAVSGNSILDSVYSGIFIEEPAPNISVAYSSNTITNAGTYGVYIRGSATGSSTFTNNTVNGAPSGKFLNDSSSFTVSGSGNNW
ncbi:CBM35 domain-containing protein [Cohnella fermenti]|uniref:Carbohydrate-binding protein n=1 Tax=Cohnella fermenti TaxID=2565925 RepID=A0A4S4BLW5_9BACL|nr:discoidin domain-containing protein [Cohnella fermenti]THF75763.1 carbohydrate-binding protein [Cohnella fermenti]